MRRSFSCCGCWRRNRWTPSRWRNTPANSSPLGLATGPCMGAHTRPLLPTPRGILESRSPGKACLSEVMLMHDERFGSLMNYDLGPFDALRGHASVGLTVVRLGVDNIPDTRQAASTRTATPFPRPMAERRAARPPAGHLFQLCGLGGLRKLCRQVRRRPHVRHQRQAHSAIGGRFTATGSGSISAPLFLLITLTRAVAQDVTTTLVRGRRAGTSSSRRR